MDFCNSALAMIESSFEAEIWFFKFFSLSGLIGELHPMLEEMLELLMIDLDWFRPP